MPIYGMSTPPLTLGKGVVVWNEIPAVASSSQAVSLPRHSHWPTCVSVELAFAADPGAIQVDLQTADIDGEMSYVTKASLTTGLNAMFVGRIEATNVVAKFARLRMVARANAVGVTATVS